MNKDHTVRVMQPLQFYKILITHHANKNTYEFTSENTLHITSICRKEAWLRNALLGQVHK